MLCMVFPWQHTNVCQQKLQVSDLLCHCFAWACLHQQLLSLLLHLLQMAVLWHQSPPPVQLIVQQLRLYPDRMMIFGQRTIITFPFSFVLITSVLEKMVSRWVIIQIWVHTSIMLRQTYRKLCHCCTYTSLNLQVVDLLLIMIIYSISPKWLFLQIRGTPWTTDYSDRRINVTNLDTLFDVKDANNPAFNATVQQSLQPGTNCTFYLCYKQLRNIPPFSVLGKASPASCVTGKLLQTWLLQKLEWPSTPHIFAAMSLHTIHQ